MAEIRFPMRRRGTRRAGPPVAEQDALASMAEQIRELDAAAAQASIRIAEAAEQLREGVIATRSPTRAELLAGVGGALADRTEAIREDCGRLTALIDRTAKLVAERDAGNGGPASPSADHPTETVGRADEEHGPAPPHGVSEGLRLIANQMANSGATRTEIEHRLRTQFGVRDAEQALDDIFGNRPSGVN